MVIVCFDGGMQGCAGRKEIYERIGYKAWMGEIRI